MRNSCRAQGPHGWSPGFGRGRGVSQAPPMWQEVRAGGCPPARLFHFQEDRWADLGAIASP
eukprot:5399414-Pyramimonas_sp.AAC.1